MNQDVSKVRKQEITTLINNNELSGRIQDLFNNDEIKKNKFKATLLNIALDQQLMQCSPISIVKSALALAELDLPLSKNLGQAYIVKYKADAEAVIGYKGYLQLAERSGKTVKAKPIFKCDEFSIVDDGFNEVVRFIPNYEEREEYKPQWVNDNLTKVLIAIKDNITGNISIDVVSIGKILQLVGKSPAKKSKYSPYVDWNLEMYLAKAIKYVLSKKPMSDVVARAIELDNKMDTKLVEDKPSAGSFLEQDLLADITVLPTNDNQGGQQ